MALLLAFVAPARAAEGGKAFTVGADEFGPVYRFDMAKVNSAADLAAVPGVKIAWDLHGQEPDEWLANARDVDGDGKFEVVFNVYRQLWCLDADAGKTKWKIDLPECVNNFQASVVGHFLDRKRFAVVCRVSGDVTCYEPAGREVWTGAGKRLYAIVGIGSTPLDVECAGPNRPDLDGNGKADVLLTTWRGYIVLMEAP